MANLLKSRTSRKNSTKSDILYNLEIEEEVYKAFKKLSKKDKVQLEAINKKINQIMILKRIKMNLQKIIHIFQKFI